MVVWGGNKGKILYPDTFHATIDDVPVRDIIHDDGYMNGELINDLQIRSTNIQALQNRCSGSANAVAICNTIHDWHNGSDQMVSMGVMTDNSPYGISTDICFSYPCYVEQGNWKIAEGLEINEFSW